VPFMAPGSGFVNLAGDYTLGPGGANGAHIAALVRKYSPHIRMLERDSRADAALHHDLPDLANTNDALLPFGFQVAATSCRHIVVHDMLPATLTFAMGQFSGNSKVGDAYFVSCAVVPRGPPDAAILAAAAAANRALDHLEDACPALFQPARDVSILRGDTRRGYVWERQYVNTGMNAWVIRGYVRFQAGFGGPEITAGSERAWEKAPRPVECGLIVHGAEHGYFFTHRR